MKKMIAMVLALAALCLCLVPAALAEDDKKMITVTGSATVVVDADTGHLQLGVVSYAKEAAEASQINAQLVEKLKAALAGAGIGEEDISTSYYYVNARRNYNEEPDAFGNYAIAGYDVNNTLNITVKDISQMGSVIDLALANGANSVDGISFSTTKAGEAQDSALTNAIQEAGRKAALVAAACGGQVGEIVAVAENNNGSSVVINQRSKAFAEEAGAGFTTQISSDGLSFTATVTVTYELKK